MNFKKSKRGTYAGKKLKFTLSSTKGIDQMEEIAEEFMRKIFGKRIPRTR